uniref:(northern house mosquito) hypothetical protein n=1 Tax=Culex pipiens TaxID=7175 RepID=A0A8D8IAQ9_CULPI
MFQRRFRQEIYRKRALVGGVVPPPLVIYCGSGSVGVLLQHYRGQSNYARREVTKSRSVFFGLVNWRHIFALQAVANLIPQMDRTRTWTSSVRPTTGIVSVPPPENRGFLLYSLLFFIWQI